MVTAKGLKLTVRFQETVGGPNGGEPHRSMLVTRIAQNT
jgi:hypothetical protein